MSDAFTATLDALRRATGNCEIDLDEQLQPVIDEFGWAAVCDGVFEALESKEAAIWHTAAAAIWGAVLDKRELDANRAIALVYFRLDKPDEEDNLAWSIASKLKGVGYLSSYDPRLDPPVQAQLEQLRVKCPQIANTDGNASVQAYIAAMPAWQRDVGRRLDALIARNVPGVRKAVKWNWALYGMDDQRWFLGIQWFTKFVKVAFFRGTSLCPLPPGASKTDWRYLDIHEDDEIDEAQLAAWIKQASELPGEKM